MVILVSMPSDNFPMEPSSNLGHVSYYVKEAYLIFCFIKVDVEIYQDYCSIYEYDQMNFT